MTDRAPAPSPRANSIKKKGSASKEEAAGIVTTATTTVIATATFTTVTTNSPTIATTSTANNEQRGEGGAGSGDDSNNSSANIIDAGKDTITKTRHCTSLPLFYSSNNAENVSQPNRPFSVRQSNNLSDICGIGARPGMECMPLRAPPGPYHYHHVADQTKSLQELQNEVGALLEFRDLVIETFPDLKHKMASMSTTNTLTGMASGSSLASRREWEPGIRVKRKLGQKETAEMSSSLIRSRSNSHSGKKEPKSGEGNGSVVQDSGFSTETSSSKEAHSASSTTGAMQGAVASNRIPIDSDDELLNLLDVIHRKSNRLREEVEHLQSLERDKFRKNTNSCSSININSNIINSGSNSTVKTFQDHVTRLSKEDIQILRKERDRLLDTLAEMEAETITERIKATNIQDQFEELHSVKKELEEQLKVALSQKLELHSRLQELYKNASSNKNLASSTDSPNYRQNAGSVMQLGSTNTTTTTPSQLVGNRILTRGNSTPFGNNTFTPVQLLHQLSSTSPVTVTDLDGNSCSTTPNSKTTAFYPFHHHSDYKQVKNDLNNLGRLDGVVSSPNRVKVRVTDSKKVAAILLETNVLELQRHLLTLTVHNQVLNQRLEQAMKSRLTLLDKLGKSKEVIDDMKFLLEEKDIELEGTKAQLRVLEAKTASSKSDYSTETNRSSSTMIISPPGTPTQISTPSMKAMTPLAMEEIQQHSSSTESAQDQTEREARLGLETPKRRPSKIPLPGTKGYLAPKPPTGRTFIPQQRSPSSSAGSVSSKSLSRSTGSLYGKSGPPSVNKRDSYSSSLNRPESAQSLRKDTSLGTSTISRSSTSSIPVSAKSTPSPQRISSSPLPRPKRDSLTSRARHLDSLSRIHTSNSSTNGCYNSQSNISNPSNNFNNSNSSAMTVSTATTTITTMTTGSTTGLPKASSKKDLSSSFTQGQLRDRNKAAVSVRRVSSASIGRNASAATAVDLQPNDADSGKILRKTVSYDIQELNKLSRSSSYNRPVNSYSSSIASTSSTSATPSTTTIVSTSSSTPSSPMRSCYSSTNPSSSRNGKYTARDLIREFMAKNASPPAILKPSYQPFEYSKDLDIAYRHPQLLRAGQKQEPGNDVASSSSSSSSIYNDRHKRLVEGRIDAGAFVDSNSNAVPNPSSTIRNCSNVKRDITGGSECKLVGHVAENIIKTWEQINSIYPTDANERALICHATGKRDLVLARQVSSNSEESEPMIYYQPVDENKASFRVNKVIYSEQEEVSDNFYDSIENTNNEDDSEENIVSISQDDAGEDLIGVDSYERIKEKWSLDSDIDRRY